MLITGRLNQILRIFLGEGQPVAVKELATRLNISRRTVFRELENTDFLLGRFGLRLGTAAGKGLVFEGNDESRARLLMELDEHAGPQPAGKHERQSRLALLLLRSDELQKLYCYAAALGRLRIILEKHIKGYLNKTWRG